MPLSDTAVRTAKARDKRYELSDEKGLYLQVKPGGSKLWRLKYRFGEREKKLAFGNYPEVSLSTARGLQLEARRLLASGIDPGEHKKQAKRVAKVAGAQTFEAIAREWFAKYSNGWAESHSSKVSPGSKALERCSRGTADRTENPLLFG